MGFHRWIGGSGPPRPKPGAAPLFLPGPIHLVGRLPQGRDSASIMVTPFPTMAATYPTLPTELSSRTYWLSI